MREDLKKLVTIGGGLAFLMVLLSYGVYQGRNLLFGSELTIASVEQATSNPIINLSGVGARSKLITINGRTTLMDSKGSFSESVALLPGLNVITVTSTDAFGKIKSKTLYTYHTAAERTAVRPSPTTEPETNSIIN